MSYLIAAASSDGIHIDQSFGATLGFWIYEVTGTTWKKEEFRPFDPVEKTLDPIPKRRPEIGACKKDDCNAAGGGACGGSGNASPKLELIEDCRCLIAAKIGFQVVKQLEKRAITGFDIECTIDQALSKITAYFDRVDSHRSLRGFAAKTKKEEPSSDIID